jgi:hypothetical protein
MSADAQKELNKLKELLSFGFIQEEEFDERAREIKERYGLPSVPSAVEEAPANPEVPFVGTFSATDYYFSPTMANVDDFDTKATTNTIVSPSFNTQPLNNYDAWVPESATPAEYLNEKDPNYEKKGNSHEKESCECSVDMCYVCNRTYPRCCNEDHQLVCLEGRGYSCPFREYGCYESGMTRFGLNKHLESSCQVNRPLPACPTVTQGISDNPDCQCKMWTCVCGITCVECAADDHINICREVKMPCPSEQYGCTHPPMTMEELRMHLQSGECFTSNSEERKIAEESDVTGRNEACIFDHLMCPCVSTGYCTEKFDSREDQRAHFERCNNYTILCPSCREDFPKVSFAHHAQNCKAKALVVPDLYKKIPDAVAALRSTVGWFTEEAVV